MLGGIRAQDCDEGLDFRCKAAQLYMNFGSPGALQTNLGRSFESRSIGPGSSGSGQGVLHSIP